MSQNAESPSNVLAGGLASSDVLASSNQLWKAYSGFMDKALQELDNKVPAAPRMAAPRRSTIWAE